MKSELEESTLIRKEACPHCGSSDANALYSDGHHFCFSCNTHTNAEENTEVFDVEETTQESFSPIRGESIALGKRKLSADTCKMWGYEVGNFNGQTVQIANYRNDKGRIVGQKIRFPNKDFIFKGNAKNAGLYGQHLWRDGGKMVTVVEGELDALSMSQAFQNRWPVVSIGQGAAGAKRSLTNSLEWLEKFDSVILMFDQDEAGRKATEECAGLFSVGKCKVAKLPLKDASDMLQNSRVKELVDAVWEAKTHRPDGILAGQDVWDIVTANDDVDAAQYPYNGLNEKTQGLRKGEIVTVTAGSGIGKSQLTREFAHSLLKQGETIGYIALEESVKRTALGLMAIEMNQPLHLGTDGVTQEELRNAFDATVGSGRVYLYDHWGSTDSDNLLSKIRYLSRGCNCSYIILDHLSIVVSGMGDGDERRLIDNTMTKLRTLTEELHIGLILVSHLKRPSGDKGHEEGAVTTLAQLRGSAAIAQLSDMVLGLERNQQDKENPNLTTVRILKNRWTGETGESCSLRYSKETGRMVEEMFNDEPQEDDPF